MPGVMSRRFCVQPRHCLASSTQSGRGPTRLMSPPSTLRICGSSSRLQRRSQPPTRVTRGSSFILNIGPEYSLLARRGRRAVARRRPSSSGTCRSGTACRRGPCAPGGRTPDPRESSLTSNGERRPAAAARAGRSSAADEEVEAALDGHVEAAELDVADVEQRDALDVVDQRARADDLEEARHDVDAHAVVGAGAHDAAGSRCGARARTRRSRGRRAVRPRSRSRSASVPRTRVAVRSVALPCRRRCVPRLAVVEEADEVDAVLGMLGDLVGQRVTDLAGADDEHALLERRSAPTRRRRVTHRASGHQDDGDGPEGDERVATGARGATHEHEDDEQRPARRRERGEAVETRRPGSCRRCCDRAPGTGRRPRAPRASTGVSATNSSASPVRSPANGCMRRPITATSSNASAIHTASSDAATSASGVGDDDRRDTQFGGWLQTLGPPQHQSARCAQV